MAKEFNQEHASYLWDMVGVTVENVRTCPRQHAGNVIFCGYADILLWIYQGDEAVPLLQLCGNSIKRMGENLHFDPKSEEGKGDQQGKYFPQWFPLDGAARAMLTRKLADLPAIQDMVSQALAQLTAAAPAVGAQE